MSIFGIELYTSDALVPTPGYVDRINYKFMNELIKEKSGVAA